VCKLKLGPAAAEHHRGLVLLHLSLSLLRVIYRRVDGCVALPPILLAHPQTAKVMEYGSQVKSLIHELQLLSGLAEELFSATRSFPSSAQ